MSVARYLSFLFALSLIGPVAADAGDDFSNNLFSDLAPLLALFGERVTMQFMSQSMGWADDVILAMAPLGIITAIVSAIRVGGPTWLKAIIGRARENLAVAEVDLMSSTSQEVCELWNGQEVVRCMGSAPVAEFICLLPATGENSAENSAEVKAMDLDTAKEKEYLEDLELNIREEFRRWRAPKKTPPGSEETGQASSQSVSEIIIIRNKSAAAPNISLNSHDQFWRGELRAAAVLGAILQLGVLMYSGFATYYPTLKFQKDGHPIADYAFPCTAAGTLVLVAGMLLCAHVVESSTREQRYQARQGRRARIVWLQQTKTVSDQVFNSFAIFAKDDRAVITTSSRDVGTSDTTSSHIDESRETRKKRGNAVIPVTVLELKAVLGTVVGLLGFVVQFVGLRGMHFSASIAQLIAVFLMTCLRAWVRRGLAKPPQCKRLSPGFELEWFAMTLGDPGRAPWLSTPGRNSKTAQDWRVVTGGGPETYKELAKTSEDEEAGLSDSSSSEAHRVMMARRDLAKLADWRGPASTEAVSLARAIEVTMDSLFGSSPTKEFTWSLEVCYARPCTQSDTQSIYFRFKQQNGKWKAYADKIEAALSLWLYSVNDEERINSQGRGEQATQRTQPPDDDTWLRTQDLPAKRSLRLLGQNTPGLHRDLQWWVPRDTARITEVEEDDNGMLKVENHRVVGCGSNRRDAAPKLGEIGYKSQDLAKLNFDPADKHDGEGGARLALLATESHNPLKLLYAQDLFSAFMWAAAKALSDPIKGGADIRPEDSGSDNAWQSFTLRNDSLSKLARDIEDTGLGSLDQVYLSIIPPLSVEQKLPQADAIVELARHHAKRQEELQHWKEAGDTYLWLLRVAKTLAEPITTRATAVLMEYLRTLTLAIELREARHYNEIDIKELKKLKSKLEEELRSVGCGILSNLMRLYEEQGRSWNGVPLAEVRSDWVDDADYPKTFSITELHRLAQTSSWSVTWKIKEVKEGVNAKDIHDWMPLHYAAAKGPADAAQALLNHRADVNPRDLLGRTPLHYACQRGETSIVQNLLREGAELDVRGRDGVAPLHCAAMEGYPDVARSLIEAGATLDVLDASGSTPLLWAAYKGHKDVVKYLWQDANKKLRDHSGRTALHLAAMAGMADVALLLVEAGADKEAKDRNGQTPLHLAAEQGRANVAQLLIEAGADKEAEDSSRETPLHLAAEQGRANVAQLLVKAGADKAAQDSIGETPLHLAAAHGYADVARLLIEAGADKEAGDSDGRTPLYWAAAHGYADVARLLVEAGADKEARDGDGRTPLYRAIAHGHADVARLLE